MKNNFKITFWGATDDVTGSGTFVEMPQGLVMVDCGLIQGAPEREKANLMPLPVDPQSIKAVIITHAHLDHSGYLPRLVKKGFQGTIYATPATAKLMQVILADSASLMDENFYTAQDVSVCLSMIKKIDWHQSTPLNGGTFEFIPAGHILGASSVVINSGTKKIVFSGDLGRPDDALIPGPLPCPQADAVIMEATYGDRLRQGEIEKELHSFLMEVSRGRKVGIIASFAVARAQLLLTLIHEFFERHPEEKIPVVMDSPMMKEANKVYRQYAHLTHRAESLYEALEAVDVIEFPREWENLKRKSGPIIILSSSGMLTGGRIQRHLKNWQDDPNAILFLPGYQGEGTPGKAFKEGHRHLAGPNGEDIFWQGQVLTSDAFSSHGDQKNLIDWTEQLVSPTHLFLLHGESLAKDALKQRLQAKGLKSVLIPHKGTVISL